MQELVLQLYQPENILVSYWIWIKVMVYSTCTCMYMYVQVCTDPQGELFPILE